MEDKLARLLYYYFENLGVTKHSYSSDDTSRVLLSLAAGMNPYGNLIWASAAAAAVSSLLQPGYTMIDKVMISNELISPIIDTMVDLIPYGLVLNLTPSRKLCAPENISTYIIARHALEILNGRSSSLYNHLRVLIEASWIGQAGYCIEENEDKKNYLLQTLKRIERHEVPPRFLILEPFIQSLLNKDNGVKLSRLGEIYFDILGELVSLASILNVLNISIDRHSFARRVFQGNNYLVCYQHPLPICGLKPDIIIFDNKRISIILVEVKSSIKKGNSLKRRLEDGVKQILLYKEILKYVGYPQACRINFPEHVNIELILAYYTKEDDNNNNTLPCKELQNILNIRIVPALRLGEILSKLNSNLP